MGRGTKDEKSIVPALREMLNSDYMAFWVVWKYAPDLLPENFKNFDEFSQHYKAISNKGLTERDCEKFIYLDKVQNAVKWLLKKQKNARMIELYNTWYQAAKKDANALKEFLKLQDEFFKDAQVSEFAHLSEVAFMNENFENQFLAIEQALAPDAKIVLESTANGLNAFSDYWNKATSGESPLWKPFFFPWQKDHIMHATEQKLYAEQYKAIHNDKSLTEEELTEKEIGLLRDGATMDQLMWRRLKISNSSEEQFCQEFPSNPTEAFVSTGNNVFSAPLIHERLGNLYLTKKKTINIFVANQNSVINFGLKLDELESLCKSGKASEDMQVFYGVYKKAYPVNDSDCVVNCISHKFEKLQLDLQRKITSEGTDMLKSFVSGNDIDANTLVQVNQIYQSYKRFLRIQAKRINASSKDNIKNKILSTAKINESMRKHCRKKLMDICGTNQSMFDALVSVSRCDNKAIWDLMGDSITTIIRGKN